MPTPPGTVCAEELMRKADVALYAAKEQGKARCIVFAPTLHSAALQRPALEQDLRAAVSAGDFELVFQPQLDLASRRIVGAEALIRWRHPPAGR
jgi:predicted signal transduction protein with EAL and GGDEF domain